MYFSLNLGLGLLYIWLFMEEYEKANRLRVGWELAVNLEDEKCSICLAVIS